MGLKNKALAAKEKSGETALAKQYEEELTPDEAYEKDFHDQLRKKRKISKEDLLSIDDGGEGDEDLTPFLLEEDTRYQTLPSDSTYPLQNRIESLLNLIEVCKELAILDSEDDLWNTIIYNILGQVGAKEVALFFLEDNRIELKAVKGFIIPEDFKLSKRSGLERVLSKDLSIHYAREVEKRIVGTEQSLLQSLNAELIVPVLNYTRLEGFFIIGKPIGGDFHPDDILYLKLLGELLGSFHHAIKKVVFMDSHKNNWIAREKEYGEFIYFQHRIQNAQSFNEARDVLKEYLDRVFLFHTYLFFIKEENNFSLHTHKGLQEKTLQSFKVNPADNWLINAMEGGWRRLEDFREDTTFMKYFSAEDRAILKDAHALALRHHGSLAGLFLLFDVIESAETNRMAQAQTLLLNYFWYSKIEQLSDTLQIEQEKAAGDPLHAIEAILNEREEKLSEKNIPFCVYTLFITNGEQLRNLLNDDYAEMKKTVSKTLKKNFGSIQYFGEVLPDRFLLVMDGIEKDELWSLDKRLHKKLKSRFDRVMPVTQSRLYSRPSDAQKKLETLLFI